jgi:hypothetical protein
MVLMFTGRIGTITVASALAIATRPRLYQLPEERPIIANAHGSCCPLRRHSYPAVPLNAPPRRVPGRTIGCCRTLGCCA